MVRNKLMLAAAILSGGAFASPAAAQNEQFIPILSYRTGAYAVNGVPCANGIAAVTTALDATAASTASALGRVNHADKGVECYERLKGRVQPTRPSSIRCRPALPRPHRKTATDKSRSCDGLWPPIPERAVFSYNFPLLGTYWSARPIPIQHRQRSALR
jgi:branched-chain amino acid transport system substrate-binding protein